MTLLVDPIIKVSILDNLLNGEAFSLERLMLYRRIQLSWDLSLRSNLLISMEERWHMFMIPTHIICSGNWCWASLTRVLRSVFIGIMFIAQVVRMISRLILILSITFMFHHVMTLEQGFLDFWWYLSMRRLSMRGRRSMLCYWTEDLKSGSINLIKPLSMTYLSLPTVLKSLMS